MMQYINQGKKNDMVVVFVCWKEIKCKTHSTQSLHDIGLMN